MKNVDNEFFIVNTSDFFEILMHHQALVQCQCDIVCPRDIHCSMHFKLNRLKDYAEFVHEKKLNFRKVIKKIAFVFNKDVLVERYFRMGVDRCPSTRNSKVEVILPIKVNF